MPTLTFLVVILSSLTINVLSCNQIDRETLESFNQHIFSPVAAPLNWSSADCCQWEGIICSRIHGGRVTRLSLPGRGLSGTITPFLGNLSFLSYLNLSRNQLSGSLNFSIFYGLNHLQTLDLSSNSFNGAIDPSFLHQASSLITFNVSNNNFNGTIPSSICVHSPLLEILDFSNNWFSGQIFHGFGECSHLQVFRAGFNSLSGWLPYDLCNVETLEEISLPNNHFSGPINNSIVLLPSLTILELHVNELIGEIPPDIGLLSNLKQLQLHTNSLNGTLPISLTNCTNLTTLLLRNNHFGGEIEDLDFSKLQKLEAIDLGNNSFVGSIPTSLCLCRSLTAVRLAYNQLVGEVPPCMVSLKYLSHLSLSDNKLSNVLGALKILVRCDNLAVLFLSRCFHDEMVPDDYDLSHLTGFQNLQIFTLGGCRLTGQIPFWMSRLKKLKVFNLSYNNITGTIPTWVWDMPSLLVLNLTKNYLTGELPCEIGRLPALSADNTSSDLSYLALPFLFDSNQYNRLFNLPRALKVGYNNLSGKIPEEIGRLKLLRELDLNNNSFSGQIPDNLSSLVNLEKLDMSGNHLSGEIPVSLTSLHFLSSFSVANNDLGGVIPTDGQFPTFSVTSFEGNPNLCGYVLNKSCPDLTRVAPTLEEGDDEENEWKWYNIPFVMGYFVGLIIVCLIFVWRFLRVPVSDRNVRWYNLETSSV